MRLRYGPAGAAPLRVRLDEHPALVSDQADGAFSDLIILQARSRRYTPDAHFMVPGPTTPGGQVQDIVHAAHGRGTCPRDTYFGRNTQEYFPHGAVIVDPETSFIGAVPVPAVLTSWPEMSLRRARDVEEPPLPPRQIGDLSVQRMHVYRGASEIRMAVGKRPRDVRHVPFRPREGPPPRVTFHVRQMNHLLTPSGADIRQGHADSERMPLDPDPLTAAAADQLARATLLDLGVGRCVSHYASAESEEHRDHHEHEPDHVTSTAHNGLTCALRRPVREGS